METVDYSKTIAQNEERYRLTQMIGNIGSWEYNIEAQSYWSSPQLYHIFGINENSENKNRDIESCIHNNEFVKQTLQELIENKTPYDIEYNIYRKNDGEHRIIKDSALLYLDTNGNPELVRGILIDITEQKQAEQKLKQSEALLAATLIHSRFSIWSVDTENNLLYANQTFVDDFQKSFGAKLEVGKSLIDVLPEVLKPVWLNRYKRAFENNSFVEEDVIDTGVEKIYIQVSTTPIYIDGKVVGASFHGENITARRTTELEIIESKEKHQNLYNLFRLMADTMPDMLWAKNLNSEFIFTNKSMCENLLGAVDTNEPIGKTDMFFAERERDKHPEQKDWHTFGEFCIDSDKITLDEMKHKQFYEYGNIKGELLYLNVHKAPLFDTNGKLIGIVGTGRDETIKKQMEDVIIQKTENLNRTLKASTKFILPKLESIDYENITFLLKEVSGAKYVILNWFENEYSYTKSISGFENLNQIMNKYLGIDVFSKKWNRQPELDNILTQNKISILKDITKLLGYDFNENVIKILTKVLGTGEVALVALIGNNRVVGSLFFIFDGKAKLENSELIELFSYQLGQFIERTNAEKQLRVKMEEMERFHKLTVNRELNMIELKKEVNQLLKEQGKEEKYRIIN